MLSPEMSTFSFLSLNVLYGFCEESVWKYSLCINLQLQIWIACLYVNYSIKSLLGKGT